MTEAAGAVERVAAIIAPDWFPDNGPRHVLNNYPEQADKYREDARQKAREIIETLARQSLTPQEQDAHHAAVSEHGARPPA